MQKRLGEHMHKSGSKCPSQHPLIGDCGLGVSNFWDICLDYGTLTLASYSGLLLLNQFSQHSERTAQLLESY